ncbi:MAG: chorismate--pyruvate lyase [Thalassolituus sp.]|nr:MAG: chorismate--pyruvate lyase [Thalassolituus sp.]
MLRGMIRASDFPSLIHPARPAWSTRLHVLPSLIPRRWRAWLTDEGSLTARLSALSPGNFRVECQREGFSYATPTEQKELGLGPSERIWHREVILYLQDTAVVYARTAVPDRALRGPLSRLRYLGNRSLGSFLFSQPDLQREFVRVSRCKANAAGLNWARRSVFRVNGCRLMVTEAFSPDLGQFDEL